MGQENFFAGVRAYIAEHAYANARLADLIAAVAASSGKNLAAWSQAWLQTAGPNTLRCQFETDASGAFTEFAILQDAPARHPTLRPHRIAVGLYQRSAGGLARTRRMEVDVAGAWTDAPELAGVAQPDLILLNDDDTGYVIVRFDPRSLRTVTESIGELTDSRPAPSAGTRPSTWSGRLSCRYLPSWPCWPAACSGNHRYQYSRPCSSRPNRS